MAGRTTGAAGGAASETKKETRGARNEGAIIEYRRDERGKVTLYSGQVTLPYGPDGKRKRKTVYGKTKAEVREKMRAIKGAIALGLVNAADAEPSVVSVAPASENAAVEHTVAEAVARWLEKAVEPKRRDTTYRSYEGMTRIHVIPYLGHLTLSEVDAGLLDDFFLERLEVLSSQSVHYLRGILRRIWWYTMKWKWTTENPVLLTDAIPVTHAPIPEVSEERALALYESFQGHLYEAVYAVGIGLGMRIGEVLGLRWEDVCLSSDGDSGSLQVVKQLQRIKGEYKLTSPKTEKGERPIPLPAFVARALTARRIEQAEHARAAGASWRNDLGLVFTRSTGEPLVYRTVYERFQDLLVDNGFDPVGLHYLRHVCISLLHAKKVQDFVISAIVGHSDVAFTKRRYTSVTLKAREDAARAMDEMFASRDFYFGSKNDLPE